MGVSMIVGKSLIDENELIKHTRDYDSYCRYCDSLIPIGFRHREDICMNQRYYTALIMRKSKLITWDIKKDLLKQIMYENRVTGAMNTIIDVELLNSFIDERQMSKYNRRFSNEQR